ncbi:MAG: hypothetical protein OXJ53_02295 [Gammaproteobacteria bacterium]|nr:hypothetical protein [Gammaproteobacteria bacterium]MDE0273572.1 hypothetical protein [Gammaproteobacteria bacterium]
MGSSNLDNLVRIGKLKREPPSARELRGLLESAELRLADATNESLSFASRFDLAYNASHALALCSLRRLGYRCDQRYLAFQTLPHTVGVPGEVWRVLVKAHERRNLAEYEGHVDQDERLLADAISATERLPAAFVALPPIAETAP